MWSLGATLYAAVEGRSPYARESSMATLTALATLPPDTPRNAGTLRGVLIGLLRKNPRQRMKAPEAEKLLRRVASGEEKGRGVLFAPRPRSGSRSPDLVSVAAQSNADTVRTDQALTDQARTDQALTDPARMGTARTDSTRTDPTRTDTASGGDAAARGIVSPPGGAAPPLPRRERGDPRTATEETYRQLPTARSRRWPLVLALALIAVALPTSVFLAERAGTPSVGSPSATTPAPTASPTPLLTAQMMVQGCLRLPAAQLAPFTGVAKPATAPFAPPDSWLYYGVPASQWNDPFYMMLPAGWSVGELGSLFCARDPNPSGRAVAVQRFGAQSGDLVAMVNADLPAWQEAADLSDFTVVTLEPRAFIEGGAYLEYTYDDPVLHRMHGALTLKRLHGLVYGVAWVSPDASWLTDRQLAGLFQASFGLYP
jgi:hypothetical protein